MNKKQIIDILESYKPSGNIYNGYNSIEEKIDERICYLIDEIIGRVKQEPDNEWIKCSERMPEEDKEVLFVRKTWGKNKEIHIGGFDSKMKWWQAGSGVIKNEYVTHWMPLPSTEGLDDAT